MADLVVCRANMISERFGANLLMPDETRIVYVKPGEEAAAIPQMAGKHVIIIGGYFHSHATAVEETVQRVEYFLRSGDQTPEIKDAGKVTVVPMDEDRICAHCFKRSSQDREMLMLICKYLDDYETVVLNDECMEFRYGIHSYPFDTIVDKLFGIDSMQQIEAVRKRGESVYATNKNTANKRIEQAIEKDGMLVAFGDTPILESAYALARASKTNIGCLVRFNLKERRTLYTVCSLDPGTHAGDLANKRWGGGGSAKMGGGHVADLVFP